MAFSFGGSPAGAPAAMGGGNAQTGPDLEDIQTEGLGFLTLSGDSKIQLLPTPWPSDQLPPPTASLMSIASHKGLVAAAGPDAVIVATTESVRSAFEGTVAGDGNVKPYQPQLKIPMQTRISQLTFSADESYLVLSAQNGGGLAVYDVQALLQGSTQTAFEISTNGQSLRALVPNPTAEKGGFLALVTDDGNLMMANLKDRNFVSGQNGQVLKNNVSCISWSTKGKQLVAGLGDGTAYQMTPEGEGKANIPRPPSVNPGDHISSIIWLENHVFLMAHTPSSFNSDSAPSSTFHIVTRQHPANNFIYQKIAEPAGPFGLNRSPPHQFLLRLKDFPPNLQDVIIVASTASTDIGILTRSKVPLTNDKPAEKISGVFTMTEMADDSHRAQLPMTTGLGDTSPIGLALDLSSKVKVRKPIPGDDEIDESPTPLPALMVLNNEGVLATWWIIYNDSIRQKTAYPGLIAAAGTLQPTQAPSQTTLSAFGAPSKPAFGASAFGASAFGTPASGSAFGAARPATAFGAPSLPGPSTGAFGGPSALGQKASPWGTTATNAPQTGGAVFGSSAFGSATSTPPATFGSVVASTPTSVFGSTAPAPASSFGAPKFGATSTPALGMGNRASPWATGGSTAPNAAFGQAGGLGKPTSVFGTSSTGATAPASGGFASFASTPSAFATASPAGNTAGNIFGSKPNSNSFLSPSPATGTLFGGQKVETKPTNPFSPGGFVLGSTFKADPSAKNDAPQQSNEPKSSFFGGAFNSALGETTSAPHAQTPISAEADMDSDDVSKVEEPPKPVTSTPASTLAPLKTQDKTTATPAVPSPFGTLPPASTETAKPVSSAELNLGQPPKSPGFSFSNVGANTTPGPATPKASERPASASSPAKTPPSPKIKAEPVLETPKLDQVPEAPLPPDTTSKAAYTPGSSSSVSSQADRLLPADSTADSLPISQSSPIPKHNADKPIPSYLIPPVDVPGGPEDDGENDSDFATESEGELSGEASEEGSGEDLGKDLSPTSETHQTAGFTPQSSFALPKQGIFTHASKQSHILPQKPSLFGEIGHSAPVLPPPRLQGSPRSPSPIRAAMPKHMQNRPDASRSVSSPAYASKLLGSQRFSGGTTLPGKSMYQMSLEEKQEEEKRRADKEKRKEAEERQALFDEEDEDMQKQLSEELTATLTLDEFIAHTHYETNNQKDTISAQVEAVYRDINSMIDTLGINARALKCFVLGQTTLYKEEGRGRDDLESDEEWCLVEVENLSALIERDFGRELETSRVKDVDEKLEVCNNLQKDIIRLQAKRDDIKKIIQSRREPSQVAVAQAQPLSAEQAAQRHDLMKEFQKFQELLCEAEEGLTLLKVKVVSQATSNGRPNGSAGPTVEAVMRTITKMTSMAEKRSGDIDVLEGQMRRLRFGSVASNGSREGSPFATPQANRASMRSGTYGLFYTPESAKDSNIRFQSSMMSSVGSFTESPRHKKMSGYTVEEKTKLKTKLAKKKQVTDRLKKALQKVGTSVRPMDNDD